MQLCTEEDEIAMSSLKKYIDETYCSLLSYCVIRRGDRYRLPHGPCVPENDA
jgi:hypothetical protein